MTNQRDKPRGNMGSKAFRMGTITATSAQTSEEVDTGLSTVEFMTVTLTNTTVGGTVPIPDESFPVAGSAITVRFGLGTGDRTYRYYAIGY